MNAPIVLEKQVYFYAVDLLGRELTRKKLKIIRNVMNSTLAAKRLQLVQKDWYALTKFYLFGPLRFLIWLYLCFTCVMIQFQLFLQASDGFVPLEQGARVSEEGPSLQRPKNRHHYEKFVNGKEWSESTSVIVDF